MASRANFIAAASRFQRGQLFAEWLLSAGLETSVVLGNYPRMGYGLSAGHAICKGEEVLRIPPAVWRPFSASSAIQKANEASVAFVERVESVEAALVESAGSKSAPEHLSGSIVLAVQILLDMGVPEDDQHPYIAFLPREVETPLMWQPDEIREIYGTGAMRGALARSDFVKVVHEALFPGGQGIPRAQFTYALSLLLSRAHSGRFPLSLVPFLCCANHSKVPTCDHTYDEASDSFVVTALRDHTPGEQIFISYGSHDSARFLWQYGFVPAHHTTVADIIWAQQPAQSDPLYQFKLECLERHGLDGDLFTVYPHADGAPPPALLAKCRIMALKTEDVASPDSELVDATAALSPRNEDEARQAIYDLANMTLARYPTSLQEDEQMSSHSADFRLMQALILRVNEKLILQKMAHWATSPQTANST